MVNKIHINRFTIAHIIVQYIWFKMSNWVFTHVVIVVYTLNVHDALMSHRLAVTNVTQTFSGLVTQTILWKSPYSLLLLAGLIGTAPRPYLYPELIEILRNDIYIIHSELPVLTNNVCCLHVVRSNRSWLFHVSESLWSSACKLCPLTHDSALYLELDCIS